MTEWAASFTGRQRGAIGIHYPITATAIGDTEAEARLSLYDNFDTITRLKLSMLRSTCTDEAVQLEVEALAAAKRSELSEGPKTIQEDCFFEHGHWWVKLWDLPVEACDEEGGEITWSVVDGPNGLELEDL